MTSPPPSGAACCIQVWIVTAQLSVLAAQLNGLADDWKIERLSILPVAGIVAMKQNICFAMAQ